MSKEWQLCRECTGLPQKLTLKVDGRQGMAAAVVAAAPVKRSSFLWHDS